MQDTVDQAHSAVPRTLADIIQDAFRAVCGHCCADSPAGCAHSPAPARMGCTWRGSPGLASGA
jgi:hypothetical protein